MVRFFKRMKSSLFEGTSLAVPTSPHAAYRPPDSLELSQTQYWTPALLTEFHARRGYDLAPYLPLILDEPKHHPFEPPFKTFKLARGAERTLQDRVRYDFALTVSDLFLEKRLDPLKKWSNAVRRFTYRDVNALIDFNFGQIGLAFRNQPYGIDFDAAVAATKVDIVEGEVSDQEAQ